MWSGLQELEDMDCNTLKASYVTELGIGNDNPNDFGGAHRRTAS